MGQTVLITFSPENGDQKKYDYTIPIEELLSEVTREEYLSIFGRVSALDVPNTGCIEFSILWRRLTNSPSNNLVRAVLFSRELESRLEELDVTRGTLVCGESLEESDVRVVEDIAKGTSLKTRRQGQTGSMFTLSVIVRLFVVLAKMGAVIGDWFLSRLAALITDPVEESIVYVPPIERLGSTLPVVEYLKSKPQTVTTEPLWYYKLRFDVQSELNSYNPSYIHQYLSVFGFIGQIRDLGTIFGEVLMTNSFTPALADSVEAEFGVRLESTMRSLVRDNLCNLRLIRGLVLRRSLRTVFAADYVEKVVIGTLDPIGRAVVHEASEQDVQVFHIPHSIATTFPPYPETDVIQFVAGEWDVQYYERTVPRGRRWQWVEAGRPYLSDLATQYGNKKCNQSNIKGENDRLKVLLATQPFSLSVRKQFVETILSSLSPDRFEVTVKTHPGEDVKLYEDVKSEYENLRVVTTDLYEEIVDTDLTVTINSNVGLESIIIGTPTVCFNAWEPFLFEPTYATADEVPVFKSEDELKTFVNQLDSKGIAQLKSQQQAFVENNYIIDSNIPTDIANHIESGSAEM